MDATRKMAKTAPAGLSGQNAAPFRGLGFDFSGLRQALRPTDGPAATAPGPDRAAPQPAAPQAPHRD